MKKHILYYLAFWLPAFVISWIFDGSSMLPLKWFFSVIMILGWCANTALISRRHWRGALSGLFIYFGVNLMIIVALYIGVSETIAISRGMLKLAGFAGFTPMEAVSLGIFRPDTPRELYATLLISGFLFLGWTAGVIWGWIKRGGDSWD